MYLSLKTVNNLKFITIRNDANLEVTLCDLGASIFSIKYCDEYMTHTLSNEIDYLDMNVYHGKTIGPVAGRIWDKSVSVGGKECSLITNEGDVFLHSGFNGISTKTFTYNINQTNEEFIVRFEYNAKDLEACLPGNINYAIIYKINKLEPIVRLEYEIVSDKDTILNPTNHSYFMLAEKNIDKLSLYINANEYLKMDLLTMRPIKKENVFSSLDFSATKLISKDINDKKIKEGKPNGYDHYFYFREINDNKPQIILESPRYKLDIITNSSGVQIYSSNYPCNHKFINEDRNTNQSIAIEPQESWLTAHKLNKDELFKRFIEYRFSTKEE